MALKLRLVLKHSLLLYLFSAFLQPIRRASYTRIRQDNCWFIKWRMGAIALFMIKDRTVRNNLHLNSLEYMENRICRLTGSLLRYSACLKQIIQSACFRKTNFSLPAALYALLMLHRYSYLCDLIPRPSMSLHFVLLCPLIGLTCLFPTSETISSNPECLCSRYRALGTFLRVSFIKSGALYLSKCTMQFHRLLNQMS